VRPIQLYIAAPYTTGWERDPLAVTLNVQRARDFRADVEWALGEDHDVACYLPHSDLWLVEDLASIRDFSLSVAAYQQKSNVFLLHSDGMILGPGWQESAGCLAEKALAERVGIPVLEQCGDEFGDEFGVDRAEIAAFVALCRERGRAS
jgi:hypothetical protein